jgi:hypothetical protein
MVVDHSHARKLGILCVRRTAYSPEAALYSYTLYVEVTVNVRPPDSIFAEVFQES